MKHTIYFVTFLFFVFGCDRQTNIQINKKEIIFVEVYKIDNQGMTLIRSIRDIKLIGEIVACIEDSEKEVIKFVPKYKLVFHCNKEEFSIVINGKAMSFKDGVKYRLHCDLLNMLNL